MGKPVIRIRLLSVVTAVALLVGISAGSAQAVSYQGSSRTAAVSLADRQARVAAAASSLAPCIKPLFGPDKDCESTSPTVDRWVTFYSSAVESCTYTLYVNWGDGSNSQLTFVDPNPNVTYLIASHTYSAETMTITYIETVTSVVNSGTCTPVATTVFHFTHLLSAAAPWQPATQLITKCNLEAAAEFASLGLGAVEVLGLFALPGGQVVGLLVLAGSTYLLFKFIDGCVVNDPDSSTGSSKTSLPPLPAAFAYGVKNPGKRFKPHGKVPARPQITGIYGYQNGSLVYFSLTYADPGHDAKGFGFVGVNGAGWALEIHPFTSPSYGIVGKDRIDYPFNLLCGTPQEYTSWVEAWIYDSQGIRSNAVEVALSCTT